MSRSARSLSLLFVPLTASLLLSGITTAVRAQPNNPPGVAGGASAGAQVQGSQVESEKDRVTIYRCTDAQGRLSLRDSPCAAGQRQETRSMQRPKDAPVRPPAAAPQPALASAAPPPETRVVLVQPPQPLYECVTPDGERYLSDTAEGNPRLVPQWANGGPMWAYAVAVAPPPPGQQIPPHPQPVIGYSGLVWIRDTCSALPQREVCDRLRERREEVRRRFFNAQPSERAVLGREERSIGARLDNDCR